MGLLNRAQRRAFNFEMWRSWFESSEDLAMRYKPEEVLRLLFNFGVIGMKRANRTLFKYRHSREVFDKTATLVVHRGLEGALSP